MEVAPYPLVERDTERATLRDVLAAAREGQGGAVLVEGEAGIGKTTLLADACATADGAGPRLLRACGSPLDEGAAYGVTRQLLLPPVRAEADRQRLLQGAAAMAEPALLAREGVGPAGPEAAYSVREGLSWLVAALAEDAGPLAIVVDDLHWADAASVRFLRSLAGRVAELPVALILAARPPPAWQDPGLAADLAQAVRVLRPARLSRHGVAAALERRLGAQPDREFADAAYDQTAGSPFLVTALADALARAGLDPAAREIPAIERLAVTEVGRTVAARLHAVSPDARAIAHAVAILGDGRGASEAERLAGKRPGAAAASAQPLEAAGLIRGWPEPSFDHPLIRAAVLDDLGTTQRARLHDRAADLAVAAGEAERAAAHLAEAPARGSEERAALLHRAGLRAMHSGAPDAAARHLQRALEEPPAEAQLGQILFDLGVCELSLAKPTAPDRLAAAAAASTSPEMRLRAQMVAGHALTFMGRWLEAIEWMHAAVDGNPDAGADALTIARLELAGWMLTLIQTGRDGSALVDRLDREVPPDAPTRPLVEGVVALRDVTRGEPRAEVLRRVQAAAAGTPPAHAAFPLSAMPLIALVQAEVFPDADAGLEELLSVARRRLELGNVQVLSAWLALSLLSRGRLAEAEEAALAVDAGEGGAPPFAVLLAAAARGAIALERGDLDAARHWTDLPLDHEPGIVDTNFRDRLVVVRARVRLAEGDASGAYGLLAATGRSQSRWGGASPPVTQWRAHMAVAGHALGRTDEARELAEEEVREAQRFGAPRPLATALRVRARVAPERAEGDLRNALDVLAGSHADLEHAHVGADLGDLLLHDGRVDESRAVLRPALDLAWSCGADALAERIRASLVAAGARPRRPELTGVRALTPAEARTARMAVTGATNRELAEALFVTEKTVETHLTAAYRKLNIAGRPQLPAALGSPSQGATAEKTGVPAGGGRT